MAVSAALLLSGCGVFGSDDGPMDRFAAAFNKGDVAAAAELTTDPAAARETLQAVFDGIGDTEAHMDTPDGDGAELPTEFDWTVPAGDTVHTEGAIALSPDGSRVQWSPQIIDARLRPGGGIVYSDVRRFTAPIVDRSGVDLMHWAPVTQVVVDAGNLAAAGPVADAVSTVEPSITAQQIADAVAADPAAPYTVITLRDEDLDPIRGELEAVDGVQLVEQGKLISAGRNLDSPVFGELREYWRVELDEGAGWSLTVSNPEGDAQIGGQAPAPLDAVRTTMDVTMQAAAQRAVDARTEPAAIVAMSPETGGVLAVAQNEAARRQGPIALTGLFPPGSTFKTVTTSAALQAGVAEPDSMLPCPARVTVDGRSIPNDDDFDLGSVPLHTAFAQSCNTTQAIMSADLAPSAMRDAAASLGFGVDFVTPALTTVTGTVPVTEPGPARVEAAIGQGTVTASPFGITEMVASLANGGRMVLPMLVEGEPATADQQPPPLEPATVDAVRAMMREAVRSGTARSLSDIDGLGGKTGTAEVADGPAHGWFAGIRGDVAFTAFIQGADSSGPAVTMAGDFLRGARNG
ncbi:penicillin-binding transpeptidase domain-containing protein [Tomitella gaofuii]|uniref:penicillin-binding transpeptidase domain-containing protein n=1 Tax=Tomitella gaofuii TaxID=2760083 RepID=UPI001F2167AF|nr:penicillin-binding transpeptidase domain-containing protein [Tomitella gaofuii]